MDYDDFEDALNKKHSLNTIQKAMLLIQLRPYLNQPCPYCKENLAENDEELLTLEFSRIHKQPVHSNCKRNFEYGVG